ncbi:MAG: hypothetical protein JWN33_517 [Candidatus Saccharibacteria bacterium]|nr:hypothetical protein [Candidatus Saccharibacteria bacterium]
MCGRYTLYQIEKLQARYNLNKKEAAALLRELKKRYNIAPTQFSPVVTEDKDKNTHIEMMRWGYMPAWAKDPKDVFKYKTFNARSEEIFGKRTWKDAILYRRCLIPANGFYEWQKREDGKQPYFIRPHDDELFSFAGLYATWNNGGVSYNTFSILTTNPNDQMESIHNRMPVILHRDQESEWLNNNMTDPDHITNYMAPYENGSLELFEVSRDVNASRIDDETLVMPINSR